jgi:hypothetical protein
MRWGLRRKGPYPEAQKYADLVLALRPMFVTGEKTAPAAPRSRK